jgi:hypothetical protein
VTGLFPPPGNPRYDSWYSAETASINSWTEKRAEYERNVNRQSDNSGLSPAYSTLHPAAAAPTDNDDDNFNIFEGRDVQVLVSSVRRSQLRVTNPDVPQMDESSCEYAQERRTHQFSHSRQSSSATGVASPTEIHVHKRARSDIGALIAGGRTSSGELTRRISSISAQNI